MVSLELLDDLGAGGVHLDGADAVQGAGISLVPLDGLVLDLGRAVLPHRLGAVLGAPSSALQVSEVRMTWQLEATGLNTNWPF